MKLKLLMIAALLASAVALAFGQAPHETFAFVTDAAPNFRLKWDVYLPATQGQYPAVLVIFGDRFLGGNRQQVAGIAAALASQGFVALAIDYRTDEANSYTGQQVPVYAPPASPNQPGDVKLAVTAARTGVIPSGHSIIYNWIIPGGKVGAVGGSAGASHALWCAATGSLSTDKLDAAVLFSGAYEFDDGASLIWQPLNCGYGMTTFCLDVNSYCQVNPAVCSSPIPAALHDGSPIYQVGADVSPLFWISNPGDPITPSQFSDLAHLIASLHLDPNVFIGVWLNDQAHYCNHSFDNWSTERNDVVNWLHARLDASP